MYHEHIMETLKCLHKTLTNPPGLVSRTPCDEKLLELYYAEYHYLRYFMHQPDCLHIGKILRCSGYSIRKYGICVTLTEDDIVDGPTGKGLRFIYFDGDDGPVGPNHGLIIVECDTSPFCEFCYERQHGQNPKTEWIKNQLADLRDETGQYVFSNRPSVAC